MLDLDDTIGMSLLGPDLVAARTGNERVRRRQAAASDQTRKSLFNEAAVKAPSADKPKV